MFQSRTGVWWKILQWNQSSCYGNVATRPVVMKVLAKWRRFLLVAVFELYRMPVRNSLMRTLYLMINKTFDIFRQHLLCDLRQRGFHLSRWWKSTETTPGNGWDKVKENLTCMAMGYHQNAFYENCSFHETKNKDTTNTYMHYNCIKLTNCEEKLESKLQFCQGIYYEG